MRKKIIENPFLDGYRITFLYGIRKQLDKCASDIIEDTIITEDKHDGVHLYQGHNSVICIYNTSDVDYNLVIHEITHAVQRMLDYLSIVGDYRNTELVANLMAYYITEGLKFYKVK